MENSAYKTALGLVLKSMISDDEVKLRSNHQIVIPIGPTPQVLLDIGMPDLPLAITGKVIDKVFFDHGIPKGTLERIYTLLEAPKAIYKGHQGNPGSAVITFEVKNGSPILIAVHPGRQLGGRADLYNNVASMYAKTSKEPIEVRWKKEGLLLWEAPQQSRNVVLPLLKVVK